jgi:hypothetical protein
MAWRIPTEADLTATLSQEEVDAFRAKVEQVGEDSLRSLIVRTAEFVRGFLRTGGVKMDPAAGSIPDGLISPAMDYAAGDVLKRVDIVMNSDRAKARGDALELFRQVSKGDYRPEPFGATEDSGGPALPQISDPDESSVLG